MTDNFIVKRAPKPWIVVETYEGRVYHFETRKEAEAFAKAEQANWDQEYRDWCRREVEYSAEAAAWNRRSADLK
jgi:hypothetical protein